MGDEGEGTVECSKGAVVDPFVMTARGYNVEERLFSSVLMCFIGAGDAPCVR